jgi:rubrerythrin
MNKSNMITSLKNAMRAELDSIFVYNNALANAKDVEVITFFRNMVKEERTHYNMLLDYYQTITNEDKLKAMDTTGTVNTIFTDDFNKRIASNQVLFSAVSVAVLLEKNASEFYGKAAKETNDIVLKEFFLKMESLEKEHYDMLNEIAKEAENFYHSENRFVPF